jgi:hypothetical protein
MEPQGSAAPAELVSACTRFWASPPELLCRLAVCLEPEDAVRLARVSRATAPLGHCERLWRLIWLWPQERGSRFPPAGSSTWLGAHVLQSLYHRASLQLARVVPAPDSPELLQDVTCPCYTRAYRIYGYNNGLVRVINSGEPHAPYREFQLDAGSIRHLQVTSGGSLCFAGSWDGAVHCIDLRPDAGGSASAPAPSQSGGLQPAGGSGGGGGTDGGQRVRRIVSGLAGPVYCIRISEDRLYTCGGGGASEGIVCMWDVRDGGCPDMGCGGPAARS